VLAGDTHVRQAQNVFRPEQIQLVGGGGTDMATLIVEAAKERPKPHVILTITDGETAWPSHRVDVPVLACLTRAKPSCPVPSWIQKVVLVPTSRDQ
jgi:predicted metal-dependent peptidase